MGEGEGEVYVSVCLFYILCQCSCQSDLRESDACLSAAKTHSLLEYTPAKYLTLQTHTHTFTSQAGGHTVKPQPQSRLRPGDGLLSMWLEGTPALECVQILLLIPVCQLCFNLRPRGPLAFTAPLGVRMMAVHDCTSTSGNFNKLSFRTGFGPQILRFFLFIYFFMIFLAQVFIHTKCEKCAAPWCISRDWITWKTWHMASLQCSPVSTR